jgi:ADP-ribose pyrophosphatase YjhB (NUDIX family)
MEEKQMTADNLAYPDLVLPRLRYQYCPMCTAPLTRGVIADDGISRVLCPACGWVHYPTNAIGVCTVVKHAEAIVAILPAHNPPETPAAFPAGHCEYGESPEEAAVREVLEETGLEVELERCLGWFYNPQAAYPGPNVTFFFEAHSTGGSLKSSAEGQAAAFPLEQFPPISPSHKGSTRAMQLYRSRRQAEKGR